MVTHAPLAPDAPALMSPGATSGYRTLYPDLAPLYDRGISAATIDHFEIRPATLWDLDEATDTWFTATRAAYPIRAADGHVAGWRSKRLHASRGLKNMWHKPREATAAHWLYGTDTIVAGEPCLLVEGDPDLWLMHTLGVPAATQTSPLGAPQPEAIAQLRAAAPSLILVAYDVDDPGQAGALRVTRALRDAGVTADALELPRALVPDKGDLTDVCHAVGWDRAAFVDVLLGCRRLPIPPPAPPAPTAPRPAWGAGRAEPVWAAFNATHHIADVAARYGPVKRCGAIARGRCPFHDDHTPSLSLYADHYYCEVCGAWGDAYDLATLRRKSGVPARAATTGARGGSRPESAA